MITSIYDELIAVQVESLVVAAGNKLILNVPIVVDPKVAQYWLK
ncbi:MAG: hypothetical protein AB1489_17455 [Acidobacteriota bacterium]